MVLHRMHKLRYHHPPIPIFQLGKKNLALLKNRYEKGDDIYDLAHTTNFQEFLNFKYQ